MAKVKVYNDNSQVPVWKENFKGDPIEIKYGEPIEMEFFDAHEFRSNYYPKALLANGQQDPRSYKMIRIEKIDLKTIHAEMDKTKTHKCHVCQVPFATEKRLVEHAVSAHADILLDEPVEEAEARLETMKKKPGRPAKQIET